MNELFYNNLPELLNRDEILNLLDKIKNGDIVAKNKLIKHSLKLVYDIINLKYQNNLYDFDDLFQVGTLSLEKAIEHFDIEKGNDFSRYAYVIINNEIFNYIKNEDKNNSLNLSLDENFYEVKEYINRNNYYDFVDNFINEETKTIINNIINEFPTQEKELVKAYYGFDGKKYSLQELYDKFNLNHSTIYMKLEKTLKKIQKELIKLQIKSKEDINIVTKKRERVIENIKSIYEYFPDKRKEEVDVAISKLTINDLDILYLRYGNDFSTTKLSEKWNNKYNKYFFNDLQIKIKRRIENPERYRIRNNYLIDNNILVDEYLSENDIWEIKLHKKEINDLSKEIIKGDLSKENELIKLCLNLVDYVIEKNFSNVNYEFEELKQIGTLGIAKALLKLKNTVSTNYMNIFEKAIHKEIWLFIKKIDINNNLDVSSIENSYVEVINLKDDVDIFEDYANKEIKMFIRNFLIRLSDTDRKIIEMYYGLNDSKKSLREVADCLNISSSKVFRTVNKLILDLKNELEQNELIEKVNSKNYKIVKNEFMIYDYFLDFDRSVIDEAIKLLDDEDRYILKLRYGDDLSNPVRDLRYSKKDDKIFNERVFKNLKNNIKKIEMNNKNSLYINISNFIKDNSCFQEFTREELSIITLKVNNLSDNDIAIYLNISLSKLLILKEKILLHYNYLSSQINSKYICGR